MPAQGIPIGELSRQTGSNIETIRYYERIGLLPMPARQGRYRSYGTTDVSRLRFVRRARELGFTIDEVRALLALAKGGGTSCDAAQALAAKHLSDVKRRISDLRKMERALIEAVRSCESGDGSECPLIDSLYAATAVQ